MGFKLEADLGVVVESLSKVEEKLDETNKKLRTYLQKPHANGRQLFAATLVPSSYNQPLLLNLGQVAPGLIWALQQVTIAANDAFTSPTSNIQTNASQSGTGAASAIVLTVPAVAGKTNAVSGFQVTGLGATGASVITVTLTGAQGGTQSYDIPIPAGATTAITPLIVSFPTPITATGPNVAMVLTVPSFGAGNTFSSAQLDATVTTGSVTAGIFTGGVFVPSSFTATPDMANCVAPGLTVPWTQAFGGKSVMLSGNQTLYVLVSGAGVSSFTQFFASAYVIEVPDTSESLLWL